MTDNPVLDAIDARDEQLGDRLDALHEELGAVEAEIDALGQARSLVSGQQSDANDDPAPADPPRRPKRGRSSKGSAKGRGSPAAGTNRAQAQERRNDQAVKALRLIGEPSSSSQVAGSSDLSPDQAGYALKLLEADGRARRDGTGRWTRWSLTDAEGKAEASTPAPTGSGSRANSGQSTTNGAEGAGADGDRPPAPPGEKRVPVDEGPPANRPRGANPEADAPSISDGTLEGRILSVLQMKRPTTTELEVELGVDRRVLDKTLTRLMRDGDIRTATEDGKRVLVGAT